MSMLAGLDVELAITSSPLLAIESAVRNPLAAGAIYWDFVDVVWLCLFTVFYLLTPR